MVKSKLLSLLALVCLPFYSHWHKLNFYVQVLLNWSQFSYVKCRFLHPCLCFVILWTWNCSPSRPLLLCGWGVIAFPRKWSLLHHSLLCPAPPPSAPPQHCTPHPPLSPERIVNAVKGLIRLVTTATAFHAACLDKILELHFNPRQKGISLISTQCVH